VMRAGKREAGEFPQPEEILMKRAAPGFDHHEAVIITDSLARERRDIISILIKHPRGESYGIDKLER
ncbi:MAG TPA: hypothetical protein VMU10_04710, partial [Desulfomonilia bacterium]|nr:hypothetical protein [Desulfomonilia bacterium]